MIESEDGEGFRGKFSAKLMPHERGTDPQRGVTIGWGARAIRRVRSREGSLHLFRTRANESTCLSRLRDSLKSSVPGGGMFFFEFRSAFPRALANRALGAYAAHSGRCRAPSRPRFASRSLISIYEVTSGHQHNLPELPD